MPFFSCHCPLPGHIRQAFAYDSAYKDKESYIKLAAVRSMLRDSHPVQVLAHGMLCTTQQLTLV